MKKRIRQIVLIIFLVSFSGVHSQSNKQIKPLTEIFSFLESEFKVQFNYAEDIVQGINVLMPDESLSISEIIEYLQIKTGLIFTLISSNIILITPGKEKVLCGYIKDKETLLPLATATIQTFENSTISDENGFFQLKIVNPSSPIKIRYLGYHTIEKPYNLFDGDTCGNILLAQNFQRLKEVLISNYIVNGINKINNGSYEINFTDFDILPGLIEADVLQSVQSFPGIQSINETVSNINIRGGTHDQNLILWDDIKMYQSGHFFGLVSLRKNGSDVAYTDGVSGTIEMQSNKHVNSKFKGVLSINLTDLNGFLDVPLSKKSSIQIAARKSINEFVKTPTYRAFFDRISQNTEVEDNAVDITNSDKSFDFYDTSLRWIYKFSDKDKLRVNFINVYNKLFFTENATVNNQEVSRESSLSQFSIAGAINYERNWSNKIQTYLEVYETDYKLKSINANIIDSQRFLQENIVSETSTKLKINYNINDRLQLFSGYHFVETEVTNLDDVDNPLIRLLVSEVLRAHGVFSGIGYKSTNNNTHFNIGIRYNYLEKFSKQIWEPRLSFSQKFLNNFTWEVLGEYKHQNTSQVINFQSDFLGIEKRRWQLSNDMDIPVIKSKQISSGISYNKNGWLFNVDGYYKIVKGIPAQSQGFQNQFEFVKSVGNYDVIGFDVLCKKAIDKLNVWLSYSHMDNTYSFEELSEKSFKSNFDVSHVIALGTVYKLKNFKFSIGFNWHTGKPTTKPIKGNEIVDNQINYGAVNAYNLKDYLRFDASVIYDFKIGNKTNANFGVSVWNVFDKKNEINNFYRLKDGILNQTVQNSLGITPNAVFRLNFL